jgi:cyclohexanecarboxylate-CoA ligase
VTANFPAGMDDSRSLSQIVADRARSWPQNIALIDLSYCPQRNWTWAQLDHYADELAAALVELGVRQGDSVVSTHANTGELAALFVAIRRIAATCVPLPVDAGTRDVQLAAVQTRARVLVVDKPSNDTDWSTTAPDLTVRTLGELGQSGPGRRVVYAPTPRVDQCAPAHVVYTSGTTGRPKGVIHKETTLNTAVRKAATRLGLSEADRVLVAAPMSHHSGFLYGMWMSLCAGATQVIISSWQVDDVAEAIERHGITLAVGVPTYLSDLIHRADIQNWTAPTHFRFVVTGAPIPLDLLAAAKSTLAIPVHVAWGSTETCMGTLSSPTDPSTEVVGGRAAPLPGVELRIVDDNDHPIVAGGTGRLEVKTDTLFEGYLDDPEATAATRSPDGYFKTGDIATISSSGYLRVTGRVADLVNRGGEKLPVFDIEDALRQHPSISDAAIIPLPDARLGQRACVVVSYAPNSTVDLVELREHLVNQGFRKRHCPEQMLAVGEFPRNAASKLVRPALLELCVAELNNGGRR